MTTKVFFNEDCRQAIISELLKAEQEIIVAVAWFNDRELFNILLDKADNEVQINLLISNDPNNFSSPQSLNFEDLVSKNGKVNRLITESVLMHNKFCVIDNKTVMTGSYNWTLGAYYKNLENIVVIDDATELCKQFKTEYYRILQEYFTYIRDFKRLLEQIIEKAGELLKNAETIDPNYIIGVLNKSPGQLILGQSETNGAESPEQMVTYYKSLSDWWDELPNDWKMFFNDKLLSNGRVTNKPAEDALLYVKSIETIESVNYYTSEFRSNNTYYTYHLKTLDGLKHLYNLKELKITGADLSQNSIEAVNDLKRLTHLNLSNNNIAAMPLNYRLGNLLELDISQNKFESLDFLGNIPALEILHCHTNSITGLNGLERARNLRLLFMDKVKYELTFNANKLTELGFEKRDFDSTKIVKLERIV
jgi:Leucine-rich repeat (LRR) protein